MKRNNTKPAKLDNPADLEPGDYIPPEPVREPMLEDGDLNLRYCVALLKSYNDWRRGQPLPQMHPKDIFRFIEYAADALESVASVLDQLARPDAAGVSQFDGLCADCTNSPLLWGGCNGTCWVAVLKRLAGIESPAETRKDPAP